MCTSCVPGISPRCHVDFCRTHLPTFSRLGVPPFVVEQDDQGICACTFEALTTFIEVLEAFGSFFIFPSVLPLRGDDDRVDQLEGAISVVGEMLRLNTEFTGFSFTVIEAARRGSLPVYQVFLPSMQKHKFLIPKPSLGNGSSAEKASSKKKCQY
jgi:hypothetical protein